MRWRRPPAARASWGRIFCGSCDQRGLPLARIIAMRKCTRMADDWEAQEVTRAVPALVLFGSDRGSEGYGWFPETRGKKYGRISLIAAGPHEFEGLGDSFRELLEAIAAS